MLCAGRLAQTGKRRTALGCCCAKRTAAPQGDEGTAPQSARGRWHCSQVAAGAEGALDLGPSLRGSQPVMQSAGATAARPAERPLGGSAIACGGQGAFQASALPQKGSRPSRGRARACGGRTASRILPGAGLRLDRCEGSRR